MPSSLPAFRAAVKAVLVADSTITSDNVTVYSYLFANAETDHYIELTSADIVQEYQAHGGKRKEAYEVRVNIWSLIPGKGDEKAKQAEENVLRWADVIAAKCLADKTMTNTVDHCEWVGGTIDVQNNNEGRWAYMIGTLRVKTFSV